MPTIGKRAKVYKPRLAPREDRCRHMSSRGGRCVKPARHAGMHKSASGKLWY